jgi:hypothetical protein
VPFVVRAITVPAKPVPTADHAVPFQRAMPVALTPPAFVKAPPTYKSFPNSARAMTSPLTPGLGAMPTVCQLVWYLAMFVAAAPPAWVKIPPAYTIPSGAAAIARTNPLVPK